MSWLQDVSAEICLICSWMVRKLNYLLCVGTMTAKAQTQSSKESRLLGPCPLNTCRAVIGTLLGNDYTGKLNQNNLARLWHDSQSLLWFYIQYRPNISKYFRLAAPLIPWPLSPGAGWWHNISQPSHLLPLNISKGPSRSKSWPRKPMCLHQGP